MFKIAAYAAAGVVILLAIAVGLFRLFLPRLPEYQDEIKSWASAAIGIQVEFTGMDARWGLRGPELKFYGAELIRPSNQARIVAAEEVGVGVSFIRLLFDRALVVDEVTISDTSVELRQLEDGSWQLQGSPIDELLTLRKDGGDAIGSIAVIGQNIDLLLIQPGDERPRYFEIPHVSLHRDNVRIAIDADVGLPDDLGRQMSVSATRITASDDSEEPWNISIETDDFNLAGLAELLPPELRKFNSGIGDLDLSLALVGRKISSASANIEFDNVVLGAEPAFDVSGRIALSTDSDGWLIAADEFSLRTNSGEWPRSSLRFETSIDEQKDVIMLDARASYVNLSDLGIFLPLLNERQREAFNQWSPDGVAQNLIATLSDLDAESPRYTISAELDGVGVAALGNRPGARGVTGSVRAGHEGGRFELSSTDLTISAPGWVSAPIEFDAADGTVLWRRNNTHTTIISDSISVRNSVFESQSNIEISIDGDSSPVIGLVSTWSIQDISVAKAYIPEKIMKPRLFLWFQDALVAGRIPRGRTELNGPLDKFPFDDGEGQLTIDAQFADLTFRYARQFPLAEVSVMDVRLENARLYSERNRSTNAGRSMSDAKIEIADLRDPVLTINAFSTGTMASIRDFSVNSPIGRVFGGQLDRVLVAGDASLTLDLTMPLTDWQAYEYTARIVSNDGSMVIEGLKPPITELSGAVIVDRDRVTSESLGGRFLGAPVSLDLRNAPPDMQQFRVIASAAGEATATELVQAFDVPLAQHLDGQTQYRAEILFPRADADDPAPLTVKIDTDLAGLSSDLPPPFQKLTEESTPLSGEISFLPGGAQIQTEGRSGDDFAWDLDFLKVEDAWDFDRGVLVLGDAPMITPEIRGLHIHGQTPMLRLEDWLALSRGENAETNVADRIRSIDLRVADLFLLGQHLKDHQVSVDRSARDWLVQFDGEQVSGSAFVPYDFLADRALVLDMQRLIIPGDDSDDEDENADDASPLDPRRLPAISLKAKELALGERFFGEVEAEFAKTADGLVTDSIIAKDPTFEIVGNGRWIYDVEDPLGSRSYLTATLTSNDVEQTMQRLNYQPGIVSEDMGILLDVNWSGGPSMDFIETLDGDVQVRFGSGQLNEVEPGAGRVFGLMSIVALPRRLSLDFRDVFQKGFGFDTISGTFRIEDGIAHTCNLSLEGPAAAVGIIGQADLVDREYSQTAVVGANVGDTLPIVGALAAGPQAAAALFLFSRIFKKPLQDIGQVFYSVSGSWDEPAVESADAEAFAASGELAGCLDDSE